jgi:hypothetical protein
MVVTQHAPFAFIPPIQHLPHAINLYTVICRDRVSKLQAPDSTLMVILRIIAASHFLEHTPDGLICTQLAAFLIASLKPCTSHSILPSR